MIIYNVTIKVDWPIHEDWLHWVKDEHIAEILATTLFHQSQLTRLLQLDDTDGPTYALQFYAHSIEHYNRYMEQHFELFRQKAYERWGNRVVDFCTLMEVVN